MILAKLIDVYGDKLNDETFIEKLGMFSVKQLLRNAKERRPGALGVAEVMVLEYNGRKKNASQHRLMMQKLYEKVPKSKGTPDHSMSINAKASDGQE